MRIYICARSEDLEVGRVYRDKLQANGHVVTSRWLNGLVGLGAVPAPGKASDDLQNAANMDLEDIDKADCVLAINPKSAHRSGTGGRHVEVGYALARSVPVVLVGERENVFHHLQGVREVPEIDDVVRLFQDDHMNRVCADTDEFQTWTDTTASYPGFSEADGRGVVYATMGIVGEASELAEKVEKWISDGNEAGTGNFQVLQQISVLLKDVVFIGKEVESFKKKLRKGEIKLEPFEGPSGEVRSGIIKECGDVFWYIPRLAKHLHLRLSTLLSETFKKITSRRERGVIVGSGDNR